MAAAKNDLTIETGATYNKTWIYKDSTSVGIPLADYEARMQIRETAESATIILELTSDPAAGIILETDATDGRIDIRIGADVTDALTFQSSAVYDLELYKPLDLTEVIRLVEGSVILKNGVTR